eukprot:364409-Chlamydomonas_euryale.AAC.8
MAAREGKGQAMQCGHVHPAVSVWHQNSRAPCCPMPTMEWIHIDPLCEIRAGWAAWKRAFRQECCPA